MLFYPSSRSLLRERGREIWRRVGGEGNCACYISLGLARGVEKQMCVDCQRNRWLILAQSGFGELRQDEAKQVWLITVPKPEHPPCPLQAAGAGGGGLSIRQDWCAERSPGFVYSVWFLPFHAEHEEQAEVNCLGGSWLCLFLCCVSPLCFLVGCKTRSQEMIEMPLPGAGGAEHTAPHLVA